MRDLLSALDDRVLIFDGAMGTMLQAADLPLSDYRGLENCSEVLNLSRPDVVRDIHATYFAAGADVVETNTFGGSALTLAEFGLGERAREINRVAAELAREAAGDERFVAGSMGPGTRLPSLGQVSFEQLVAGYLPQIEGLLDGGVDALLIETSQDLLQAKAVLAAIADIFRERGARVPVIAQVTLETTGTMLVGSDITAATAVLSSCENVDVIGMNCATGPQEMAPHVGYLGRHSPRRISVLPNAGLPELVGGQPRYPLGPEELADWHDRFTRDDGVNIVGGCCGTNPDHIRAVARRVRGRRPARRSPDFVPALASLYSAVPLRQDADVLAIGERTNANGSRRFKRLLHDERWDDIVQMGKRQARMGSHAIDVCTAYVGRDEVADMTEVVSRFRGQVPAPLVIDSTEVPVIQAALRLYGGRAVINSINLEEGEERADRLCRLARRHGAAVIALTIDEQGMARTVRRKLDIAERLYAIAVERHGLDPSAILFDPLTFTICTGNPEDALLGAWTLEGIQAIAERFPRSGVVLGLSNVSFGLKPAARHVLNSVMLYHARQRGLTAAIVHASKIVPLHRVPEAQRQAAEDLIFARDADALSRFIALFEGDTPEVVAVADDAPVAERLRRRVIDGDRAGIEAVLDEALVTVPALDIINGILLEAMREVGELFGSGQMQLPFVLQAAETMKAAVSHLEPHLEKGAAVGRGRMVLATVRGDVHDIGKNLVDIILSNNGYEVINLGIKQPIEAILRAFREHEADAIGLSGLLVKSTVIMRENLAELRRQGVRAPVILGGAALTRSFVEKDCARAYGQRVAYGRDAFAGLSFMDQLARARADGQPSQWHEPVEIDEAPVAVHTRAERPLPAHEQDLGPVARVTPPTPPFWGSRVIEHVPMQALAPLLDVDVLFKFQWGYLRKNLSREEHAEQLRTVVRPILTDMLRRAEGIIQPQAVYGYFRCRPDGERLRIEGDRGPVQLSFPRQRVEGGRCLTDYFHPDGDVVALMAVTAGARVSQVAREWFEAHAYRDYLYLHGLGVEVAEALAAWVHRRTRDELGVTEGRRYAYGYPACPDMAQQHALLSLLGAERIGLTMDEDDQLHPEQSTTAIIVHHPAARYFRT